MKSSHLVTYQTRDRILLALGYKTYWDYLQSPLWYYIRDRVLCRDNDACTLCGKDARVVHHRSYNLDTLTGMSYRWLVSLCQGCHSRVEFMGRGKKKVKRTTLQADMEYLRLRRLARK